MIVLSELIANIDELDASAVIYCIGDEPPTPETEAIVVLLPDSLDYPHTCGHLSFYMEVAAATDVLEVWSEWRSGSSPSVAEAVAAVNHYSQFDAYVEP